MWVRSMTLPTRGQEPPLLPLLRQSMFCGLTPEEAYDFLQDLGKPLNTMNFGEPRSTNMVDQQAHTLSSSLSSSSQSLSKSVAAHLAGNGHAGCLANQETALEDYLVPSSTTDAENKGSFGFPTEPLLRVDSLTPPAKWWQCQEDQKQPIALFPLVGNNMVDNGYVENHHLEAPVVSVSMVKPRLLELQPSLETKLCAEKINKSIERRQKRMLKNRESAARSRARKQAYINQLEEEVSRLKDNVQQLKKWKAFEEFLKKEDGMRSLSNPTLKPIYQLRRTRSALF